jgi:hypothetical protein
MSDDYLRIIRNARTVCTQFVNEKIDRLDNVKTINPLLGLPSEAFSMQRQTTPLYFKSIYFECREAFSHICSSPKREPIFNDSYCYPDQQSYLLNEYVKEKLMIYENSIDQFIAELEDPSCIPFVNGNSSCITALAKYLCKLSQLSESGKIKKNYHKTIILTGEYGEGKTFLVNHLLSTQNKTFADENVIVIKIDYTDIVSTGISGLDQRIADKTLRILKEIYFEKRILDSHKIAAQFSGNKKACRLFEYYMGNYRTNINDDEVDSSMSADDKGTLFKSLLKYLCEKSEPEYYFLFVIDGLDNFNRDFLSEDKFNTRCRELLSYIKQNLLESCYLIVMRNESYAALQRTSDEGRPQINDIREFKIFPVSYTDIIEKRKITLKNFFNNFRKYPTEISYSDNDENIVNNFKARTGDFISFALEFINHSFPKVKIKDETSQTPFDYLFNRNNRSIMDSFIIICRDILLRLEASADVRNHSDAFSRLEEIIDNSYPTNRERDKFISQYNYIPPRAIILNNRFYMFQRYKFEQMSDTKSWEPKRNPDSSHCSLLPNVFGFYNSYEAFVSKDGGFSFPFLIQVRTLQYYLYLYNANRINTTEEAAQYIATNFNYIEKQVIAVIKMLYANQCLEDNHRVDHSIINNHILRISARGRYIIEHLIYDYTYLQYVIDDMHIPVIFFEKFEMGPPVSLVRIQDTKNLYKRDEFEFFNKMARIMITKMLRVIYAIELWRRISALEKEAFLRISKHSGFSFNPDSLEDDLDFTDKMSANIDNIVERLIDPNIGFVKNHILPLLKDKFAVPK